MDCDSICWKESCNVITQGFWVDGNILLDYLALFYQNLLYQGKTQKPDAGVQGLECKAEKALSWPLALLPMSLQIILSLPPPQTNKQAKKTFSIKMSVPSTSCVSIYLSSWLLLTLYGFFLHILSTSCLLCHLTFNWLYLIPITLLKKKTFRLKVRTRAEPYHN